VKLGEENFITKESPEIPIDILAIELMNDPSTEGYVFF
jgi:hypothetical protein